jgi:hypothetical protein
MIIVTNRVHELLSLAQDLIRDPKDWIKDHYSEGGCYCTAGAIRAVVNRNEDPIPAFHALARAIEDPDRRSSEGTIIWWNDQDERTHAEVMALFDKALA